MLLYRQPFCGLLLNHLNTIIEEIDGIGESAVKIVTKLIMGEKLEGFPSLVHPFMPGRPHPAVPSDPDVERGSE